MQKTNTLTTAPELGELLVVATLGKLIRDAQKSAAKSRARGAGTDRFALELTNRWLKARTSWLIEGRLKGHE